jgi:hypothetical protein
LYRWNPKPSSSRRSKGSTSASSTPDANTRPCNSRGLLRHLLDDGTRSLVTLVNDPADEGGIELFRFTHDRSPGL